MVIYEETQLSIIELSPRLEEIKHELKRIADALEILASAVQPEIIDKSDAAIRIDGTICTMGI